MKNLVLFFILLSYLPIFSQTTFDNGLNDLSKDIAAKMVKINKKRIAVIDLTDINKEKTITGKYIADVLATNIVNDEGGFQVYDRQNLDKIMAELNLSSEGYIDEATAKKLGKMLAVDAIVSGNYTVLNNKIRVNIKVLDTETAFVIAASMRDVPFDADAAALSGINLPTNSGSGTSTTNSTTSSRGFNSPVMSNEQYNNAATVNSDCSKNSFGDYCFTYASYKNVDIEIELTPTTNYYEKPRMTLTNGQTQCFFSLKAGSYKYTIREYRPGLQMQSIIGEGQILIETCKSKTFKF